MGHAEEGGDYMKCPAPPSSCRSKATLDREGEKYLRLTLRVQKVRMFEHEAAALLKLGPGLAVQVQDNRAIASCRQSIPVCARKHASSTRIFTIAYRIKVFTSASMRMGEACHDHHPGPPVGHKDSNGDSGKLQRVSYWPMFFRYGVCFPVVHS